MRIRTQFIITMVLFGIVLITISTSMIIMNLEVKKIQERANIVSNIIIGASELSYLTNDYLIYKETQQLTRWQTRFDSFYNDISSLKLDNADQQAIVNILESDAQRLKDVFESTVSVISSSSQEIDETNELSSIQLSWSRIAVQSQGLIADASQLSQLLIKQIDFLGRVNTLVAVILLTILILFFISSFLIVLKRILKSIETLKNGTIAIGAGKLDFMLDDKGKDEIGDLTRAFNQMTLNLNEVTASKEDLEKEIIERKLVEEALKESEKKYHSLFKNMIEGFGLNKMIFDADGKPCDYRFLELNAAFEKHTGISVKKAIGKTVKEVIPDIEPYWIDTYGEVVLTGEPKHFEKYSFPLKKWYETYAYPAGKNQFAVLFRDITKLKKEEKDRFTKMRETALKKEREKIAAELHDTVSQILFSSSLLAESVSKIWEKDPDKALKNLKMITELNSSAFLEMRILLYELVPEKIAQESLKELIKRLVDAAKGQSNVRISMEVEGEQDYNFKIKHQVYHIAQEAINNILKHSKAKQAKVNLKLLYNELKLVITDNGIGFDIKNQNNKKKFGLNLMRERAKIAGASLDITSNPGEGSTISLLYTRKKQLSKS